MARRVALFVRGIHSVHWPIAVFLTLPMPAGSLAGVGLARGVESGTSRVTFASSDRRRLLNDAVIVA